MRRNHIFFFFKLKFLFFKRVRETLQKTITVRSTESKVRIVRKFYRHIAIVRLGSPVETYIRIFCENYVAEYDRFTESLRRDLNNTENYYFDLYRQTKVVRRIKKKRPLFDIITVVKCRVGFSVSMSRIVCCDLLG